MENLQKQINEIVDKINAINSKMENLEKGKEDEDRIDLGAISIVDGKVRLELLLDQSLFDEEDMKKLQKIAEDLQLLMLEIEKKMNK